MRTTNDYARVFGPLYVDTPKAVFAAIVADFLIQLEGEDMPVGKFQQLLVMRWRALYDARIVAQRPPVAPLSSYRPAGSPS